MKAEFDLRTIKLLEREAAGKFSFIVQPLGSLSVPPFGFCTSGGREGGGGGNKSSGRKVAQSVVLRPNELDFRKSVMAMFAELAGLSEQLGNRNLRFPA